MIKSQVANKQHHESEDEFGENVEGVFNQDIEELEYEEEPVQEQSKEEKKKYATFSAKQMEQHLEEMY